MNIDRTINKVTLHGYCFGSYSNLSKHDLELIVATIKEPVKENNVGLDGRGMVKRIKLENTNGVLKSYRRGGVIGKVLKNFHVKFTKSRSELEFDCLAKMAKLGVNVSEPIAFIHTAGILYSAWLITKEIPASRSLADLSVENEPVARDVVAKAAIEIVKLIKMGLLHLDLHPGNVLLGGDKQVYLIDFDKASSYKGSLRDLRDFYLCRWRRACLKHNLPEYLSEIMSLELRQYQAWSGDSTESFLDDKINQNENGKKNSCCNSSELTEGK